MKSFNKKLIRTGMILGLTFSLGLHAEAWADTHGELMKSAQSKLRARQNDAAQADATKARELATNPNDQIEADLLLAQILAKQGKNDEALAIIHRFLDQPGLEATTEASIRITASGILLGDKKFDQARQMVEPVLTLKVAAVYLKQAQRDQLRAVWGFSNWLTEGNLEDLKTAVQKIIDEPQEAWAGRKLQVLQEAARMVQSSNNMPAARDYYEQALKLPDLSDNVRFSLTRDMARGLFKEAAYDKAYEVLDQLFKEDTRTPVQRIGILLDQAVIASSQEDYALALKYLNRAIAVEGITPAQEADVQAKIVSEHLGNNKLEEAAAATRKLMAIDTTSAYAIARITLATIDRVVSVQNFELADSLATQLADLKLSVKDERALQNRLALIRLSEGDLKGARTAIEQLSKIAGGSDNEQLVERLQLAAAGEDQKQIKTQIEKVLATKEQLPAQDKIRALWDAASLYFQARHYEPARVLIQQAERFGNQAKKSYRVQSVKRAPVDVGSWQSSGLLAKPGVLDARFYPYNQQDAAAMFAVDVRAERPFGTDTTDGPGPAETKVAMVYDTLGWHIYVQSDEPDVEQIMSRDGKGGSSLEMFFTPGTYNEPYYQWITNLSKNKTDIYDWNSAHPFYRTLQSRDSYFNIQTQAIEKGWGTAIFISWEAFYDQMPMLKGKEQVWRFSMQRWNPAGSVTWGGRVHETGRWGDIIFEAPSAQMQTDIKRLLLKKAWTHYQQVLSQQNIYWTGLRGDQAFFKQVIEPLVNEAKAMGDMEKKLNQSDAAQIDQAFTDYAAAWEEIKYTIEAQRQTYLREKLTTSR